MVERRPRMGQTARWAVLAALAAIVLAFPSATTASSPADHFYRIEASSFAYLPAEITVQRGDPVTLELVSTDVVHGLYVDGYDLSAQADPGQSARLSFVADQTGTFRFRCSVTCGPLHPFMIGKLRVEPGFGLGRILALLGLAAVGGLWMARR
jgi:plastocyanin